MSVGLYDYDELANQELEDVTLDSLAWKWLLRCYTRAVETKNTEWQCALEIVAENDGHGFYWEPSIEGWDIALIGE